MLRAIHKLQILHRVVPGMTLMGLVIALLLAVSPELHDKLHHDADGSEHVCLATTLAANGCDDPTPAPVLPAFVTMLIEGAERMRSQWSEPSFLSACVLEHAPPFIS